MRECQSKNDKITKLDFFPLSLQFFVTHHHHYQAAQLKVVIDRLKNLTTRNRLLLLNTLTQGCVRKGLGQLLKSLLSCGKYKIRFI